jgi:polysaccharide export outer membrane protein
MKIKHSLKMVALALVLLLASAGALFAQTPTAQQEKEKSGNVSGEVSAQDPKAKKDGQKKDAPARAASSADERIESDDASKPAQDASAKTQGEQTSDEEAAIAPYYNNLLTNYRLGPEDVISVVVFNQPNYSKGNITIPPNGKISYPLIPEGVRAAGKTTEQLQEEIRKRLDEYIIDPQVEVSLDKAVSARYSVLGDVAQPGVKIMARRLSVYEALAEAGGVQNTGDKSKVVILRRQADGSLQPIRVNIKKIEKGDAKELVYLEPGDQVIVPGNRLKTIDKLGKLFSIISFARIFAGGW